MALLQYYTIFLVKHPGKILVSTIISVLGMFLITCSIRSLPSFRDPMVGFEARDTLLSSRLNIWELLRDETTASANNLSLSAKSNRYEDTYDSNFVTSNAQQVHNELNLPEITEPNSNEPPQIEMSSVPSSKHNSSHVDLLDEGEDEYYKSINLTDDSGISMMHYSLGSSKAFCGKLYEGYAQVVLGSSPRYSGSGLFNLNSMLAICQIDLRLRLEHNHHDNNAFQRNCERFHTDQNRDNQTASACCNSWSLPNLIACLNNKTSCIDIDSKDMKNTENLINICAPFYFKTPFEECFEDTTRHARHDSSSSTINLLSGQGFDQWPKPMCGSIPDKCLTCNGWIYTMLNFLVDENFVHRVMNESYPFQAKPATQSSHHKFDRSHYRHSKDSIVAKLTYTNIFLPIAKSSSLMNYYHTISKHTIKTPFVHIRALELGLKNSLFEHMISDDLKLFLIALVSILLVISIYTWSLLLSSVILLIIGLSLCLSYVIYEVVLNVPVFPFMNLLAIVISFGICSDNTMLFCKHWNLNQQENVQTQPQNTDGKESDKTEQINLDRMLQRSIISTSVATLATACSFLISAISKVIAVRCFCIFATLTVVTNYILTVIILPAALILDYRFSRFLKEFLRDRNTFSNKLMDIAQCYRTQMQRLGDKLHNEWIRHLVTTYKLYLIITFLTLLSCSSVLVFHRPTLQPADEDGIQLLSSKHSFEQYDKNLKRQFAFERAKLGDPVILKSNQQFDIPDTLPVRIVFGLIPADTGNHLDPYDRGHLVFDPKFDMTDRNVQNWLIEFCHRLKQQRFIHLTQAPDLTNCFMDTFKSWMDARSCRDPINADIDRSPCCQSYEFPYSPHTFNRCVGEAVSIVRKTPQFHPNLSAGVRFFRNTTKVAALIIEYQSNRLYSDSFSKMERFFNDIDEWVSWQINNTAPPGLRSGWFISSNLDLLALQTELDQSTRGSIMLEVAFAMMALMLGTHSVLLTLAGTLAIGTIIIVTVAVLIVLKWTLGVAESILVSLIIGLSIDFALHYSIAYSESKKMGTSDVIIRRILSEIGSPIALATVTTSLAGFIIVWSDILAYQELGVFLMLIATISWMTSTFFLLPMLATMNSLLEYSEFYGALGKTRVIKLLMGRS